MMKSSMNKVDYIIINQNIDNPYEMITGDINGPVLKEIRRLSHGYLGKYAGPGKMTICQLSDASRDFYHDGSDAVLTGNEGDVFMRMPKFYFHSEEISSDVWKIGWSFQKVDDTWKEWSDNQMIGVYFARVNTHPYAIASISGTPGGAYYKTPDEWDRYTSGMGVGYILVDYQMSNVMQMLYYATYGNTNSQKSLGRGNGDPDSHRSGETNNLGMTDTTPLTLKKLVNYWGLEGWVACMGEYISRISVGVGNEYATWTIFKPDGSYYRVNTPLGYGVPKKLIFGENMNTLVKEFGATYSTGFCNQQYVGYDWDPDRVCRSGTTGAQTGIGSIEVLQKGGVASARLAFCGDITVESDVAVFKKLPVK